MKVFFVKTNIENQNSQNIQEAEKLALFSIVPLTILAIFSGLFENYFEEFSNRLLPSFSINLKYEELFILISIISVVSIFGILFAIYSYKNQKQEVKAKVKI